MAKRRKIMMLGLYLTLTQAVKDFIARVTSDGGTVLKPACIPELTADFAMIPSGGKAGTLYSQKPVPVYGAELVTNGDFATDSDWVKGTGWSIGEDKAIATNVVNTFLKQNSILTSGKTYKITYTVQDYTSGSVRFRASTVNGTTNSGNGTYTDYIVSGGTQFALQGLDNFNGSIDNISVKEVLQGDGDFDVARNSTKWVIQDDVLVEIPVNMPSFTFAKGECPVLLTEPQSTNLIAYSEDFSNASWLKSNSSISSNQIISPDGTLNADKLIESSASSFHELRKTSISQTSGLDYTVSAFVKYNGRDAQFISYNGSTNVVSSFDLSLGTVLSGVGNIEDFGNGWYRISQSYTATSTITNNFAYGLYPSIGTNANYQGDGASGIYIYGAQLEQLPYATSYIPTSGATATRLADVVNNAGDVNSFNSEEGVLYVEMSALDDDLTNRYISISDGTGANRIALRYTTVSNTLQALITVNSVLVTFAGTVLTNITINSKIAIKWKLNDVALWVDGIEVFTDLVADSFPINTLNVLNFADTNGIGTPMYNKTKALKVYKFAPTDQQLTELTTDGYITSGNPFAFTVKTDNVGTSTDTQFTLPLASSFNGVTAEVDWGDGNTDVITAYNQAEVTHTYSIAGTYEVKIDNGLRGWQFVGGGDKDKMLNISNWGVFDINVGSAFYGCSNLTVSATDVPVITNSDLGYMFFNCSSLTTLDVTNWDVSGVTNMYVMFAFCSFLATLDVTNWDVSGVTNMGYMFYLCNAFDYSLENWNINKVTAFDTFTLGLSTSNYDATLVGWEATLQAEFPSGAGYTPSIAINFGGSTYTTGGVGDTARQSLITNFGWTITDGGGI